MKRLAKYLPFISSAPLLILLSLPNPANALVSPMGAPIGLSILEIKMTGSELLLLQNNGDNITSLSSYWLTAYNNVNPLAAGISSSSQQLPMLPLEHGQTLLLSADPTQTCGASVAGKLSLNLSDSGGYLQLSQASLSASGSITQTATDMVSWSSSASGLIQNVPSSAKEPRAIYYRYPSGDSYAWQQASLDPNDFCQLNVLVAGGSGSSSAVTPLALAATSPPATILGLAGSNNDSATATPHLPTADIGLNAPQLSELLPNPMGTGNDGTDEFIELYNPNAKLFDLTDFVLVTGLTVTHSYVFPAGTTLHPGSFQAFFSEETKLSLSNTAGRVVLLDPFGNIVSRTEPYTKAKDGESWSIAKGKWHWTVQPTPATANIIKQLPSKAAAGTAAAKKASTKISAALPNAKPAAATNASGLMEAAEGSTVHMGVLALIASVALLYGAYDYRHDITNRLFQFRAKFGLGRTAWSPFKRRRSDRAGE